MIEERMVEGSCTPSPQKRVHERALAHVGIPKYRHETRLEALLLKSQTIQFIETFLEIASRHPPKLSLLQYRAMKVILWQEKSSCRQSYQY